MEGYELPGSEQKEERPGFFKKLLAGVVLIGALALIIKLAFHAVVGFFLTLFWICVGIAAIVAFFWARSTLRRR